MKKIIFSAILFLIVYGFFELFCGGSLYFIRKVKKTSYTPIRLSALSETRRHAVENVIRGENRYVGLHPVLGWAIRENGGYGIYQANSQGIRADREYGFSPPEGIVRIACFGNSFTHCDDVANSETWEEYLYRADTTLEVMNFGVGGYGVDQAFLRYREMGAAYNPHIVLICMTSENVFRNVNVYRPFMWEMTGIVLSKPRFVLENDSLVLIENPLRTRDDYRVFLENPGATLRLLGENDYYYAMKYKDGVFDFLPSVRLSKILHFKLVREKSGIPIVKNGTLNRESEAYRITIAIVRKFAGEVRLNGSLPVVVLIPYRADFIQYDKDGWREFDPMLKDFSEEGLRVVDVLDAFIREDTDRAIQNEIGWGHYTPRANELMAGYILEYLRINNMFEKIQ